MQESRSSRRACAPTRSTCTSRSAWCMLALMLLRLGWRARAPPPALPPMPRVAAASLARATHALAVRALIVHAGGRLPGLGVERLSRCKWFGVTLPAWGDGDPALKDAMSTVHLVTSCVLLAAVALHVAGALHHAVARDGVLSRMLPRARAARMGRAALTFRQGEPMIKLLLAVDGSQTRSTRRTNWCRASRGIAKHRTSTSSPCISRCRRLAAWKR